jgi:hypothetical protein
MIDLIASVGGIFSFFWVMLGAILFAGLCLIIFGPIYLIIFPIKKLIIFLKKENK